jgi:long-chain fatty acid transport protein
MMKKLFILSTACVALFATQGDNLIGAGAKSRALAGAATSTYLGTESIFMNPALLTQANHSESSLGFTFFTPDVTAKNDGASGEVGYSDSNFEVIPSLGYVTPIDAQSSFGIGLFSVSGMGVDYRDEPLQKGLVGMNTHLVYAKLSTVYAHSFGKLSVGGGFDLAYGNLEMHALLPNDRGSDGDSHIGAGFHIGAHYEVNEALDVALTYTSEVYMKYRKVFDFDGDGRYDDLTLTQPAEIGTAIAYEIKNLRFEADYKHIFWSKSAGYQDFQWDDQDVIALGATWNYDTTWTLRGGYSYAKSPLHHKSYQDAQVTFFNLVGFPAITESHYTIGTSYRLNRHMNLHATYVYAPKVTESFGGIEATNRQSSVSVGFDYLY